MNLSALMAGAISLISITTTQEQLDNVEIAYGYLNSDSIKDRVDIRRIQYSDLHNELITRNTTLCPRGELSVYLGSSSNQYENVLSVNNIFSNNCANYLDEYFPKIMNNEILVKYFIGADSLRINAFFEISNDYKNLTLKRFEKIFIFPEDDNCKSFQINVDIKNNMVSVLKYNSEYSPIIMKSNFNFGIVNSDNFNYEKVFFDDISQFQTQAEPMFCNTDAKLQ